MENVKAIIVTNIQWAGPKSAKLPKEVWVFIKEKTKYLLEDIDGYADNLRKYLSDAYKYGVVSFTAECK